MAKSAKVRKDPDVPGKKSPSKGKGKAKTDTKKMTKLPKAPPKITIMETPARERLRKKLGKEKLEHIEARILSGEM